MQVIMEVNLESWFMLLIFSGEFFLCKVVVFFRVGR